MVMLVINTAFHGQISGILAADNCHSHWQCKGSSSYCCREYTMNSTRSCLNVSSCLGRFCTSNHDCVTPDECCWSNKCTNCSLCANNLDCGSVQYCCNTHTNGSKCSFNCVGKTCNRHSDCGAPDECCRREKCVKCSDPGCRDNYDCVTDRYCCIQRQIDEYYDYDRNHCRTNCIGKSCRYHGDCGEPSECCQLNKCVKCPFTVCKHDTDCISNQYCCGRESKGICSESCVGESCAVDEQCAKGECCTESTCTKDGCLCTSNQHCSDNLYCCLETTGNSLPHCSTSCLGKPCASHYGCGGIALGEWCRRGVCVKDQCDTQFYCDIKKYSCCKQMYQWDSKIRECKTQCLNNSCSSDSFCATADNDTHCCSTNSLEEKHFSSLMVWTTVMCLAFLIFGFVIAIKYCRRGNMQKRNLEHFQKLPKNATTVPYTIF